MRAEFASSGRSIEGRLSLTEYPRHDWIDLPQPIARWNILSKLDSWSDRQSADHHGKPPLLTAWHSSLICCRIFFVAPLPGKPVAPTVSIGVDTKSKPSAA
jgi:hypothetical protein